MNVWLDKDDDPHPEHTEEMQGRNPEMFFKDKNELLLEKALGIIADLVDPEECRFDHNGCCQEHYDFTGDNLCVHKTAKDFLKEFGVKI